MSATIAPQVRYKTITPEEAQVYLRRSKRKNVPVKKRKIDQYARDMLGGKWDCYNSQAVSIDVNSDIVNGHQRLMACVQAGVPFRTLLITGVPPESFKTEDTGRSRDAGHFFAVLGEKFYVQLAAGARALYAWERGMWRQAATASGGGSLSVANEELAEEVERRPQLRAAAEFAANRAMNAIRGRFKYGMIVGLHALTQDHPRHADFWKELVDRLSTDKKSPAYQLNRRIDMVKSRGANLSGLTTLALLTKAWNQYASGDWKELVWFADKEPVPNPLTDLKPALLPPDETPADIVVVATPKVSRPKPADGSPVLKVIPKPEKVKKGPKLRGGLGATA